MEGVRSRSAPVSLVHAAPAPLPAEREATALVGLGSNLGDREALLTLALARLAALPQTRLVAASSLHDTAPVGGPPQPRYLNAAARLHTRLAPHALLEALVAIEAEAGRERRVRWGPRTLDLDLLAYDGLVLRSPALELPHPRLHERAFVLAPLVEVAPEWVHPRLLCSARELLGAVGGR